MINKFRIFNEGKYFSSEIFQDYLVFIPAQKYIKYFSDTTRIEPWENNGIPEENTENITKSKSNFTSTFVDHHLLPDIIRLDSVDCLIYNNISIPNKVINLNISDTINPQLLIWIFKSKY